MTLLNIFAIGLGAHFFLSAFCPDEYHIALINTSFYIILIYSYMEMYAKRAYNHPNLSSIRALIKNAKKQNEIDIIKFNDVIFSTNKKNLMVKHKLLYDFIVYSDYDVIDKINPKVNKVIYFNPINFPIDYNYSICKFSFISFSVKIGRDMYQLKLSNDSENYYVVGNRINKHVIYYLLKNQCGIDIDCNYELDIIDNNVNMLTLTEKEEIVLEDSCYKIIGEQQLNKTNHCKKDPNASKLCDNSECFEQLAENKSFNVDENFESESMRE